MAGIDQGLHGRHQQPGEALRPVRPKHLEWLHRGGQLRGLQNLDVRSDTAHKGITYDQIWGASRIVHARHKKDGNVAGYVSLEDYSGVGPAYRTYVKMARKDTPDPQNKKRSLFGRRSPLDEDSTANGTDVVDAVLQGRADDENWHSMDRVDVPNTNGLYTNIRAGWGTPEWTPRDQLQNAMENLLNAWRDAQGTPSSLRPAAYLAPNHIMVEFEWAAHQGHDIRAIPAEERATLLKWAIEQRAASGNYGSFIMQIRRGGNSLGHLLIRVFRLGVTLAPAVVCG